MDYSIYVIRNIINGKYYVGQSKYYPIDRICGHVRDAYGNRGYLLAKAINKYGEHNFELVDWRFCPEKEADSWEDCYTTYYDCVSPNGYNLLKFGNVSNVKGGYWLGKKRSPQTIAKVAEKLKVKYRGEGNPFHGKTHSTESKNKMSESTKQTWNNLTSEKREEYSQIFSKVTKERWENMSEEQKSQISKNISKSLTGRKLSPEHCKKISEIKTGRKQSQEAIEKRRQSLKNVRHTEESKKIYTEVQRNRVSKETKDKIRQIIELLNSGVSVKEVAEKFNHHSSYIYDIKNGRSGMSVQGNKKAPKREQTGAKRNSPEAAERKEQIIKLLNEGIRQAEIARRIGCSKTYVSRISKISPTCQ